MAQPFGRAQDRCDLPHQIGCILLLRQDFTDIMTHHETAGGLSMDAVLQKFATQTDPGVLDEVRAIAAREGKQLRAGTFSIAQIERPLRNSAGPV
jgi:hypothetical protein